MKQLTQNIFLVGLMGVGKTTVARRLARELKAAAIDVDALLHRQHGVIAKLLYKKVGEASFREYERIALRDAAKMGPAIISCSDGCVSTPQGRSDLQTLGFAIYLASSSDAAYSRIRSFKTRPLLAEGVDAHEIAQERIPQLEAVAQAIIEVEGKSTMRIVEEICHILDDRGLYGEQ